MQKYFFFFLLGFASCFSQKNVKQSFNMISEYFDYPKDTLVHHANYILKNTKDVLIIGQTHHYLGNIYMIDGQLDKAFQYYQKENRIFSKALKNNYSKEYELSFANSWASMGIIKSQQSDFTEALKYHFKALEIYKKLDDQPKTAAIYNNIGVEYLSLNQLKLANDYFLKAIEVNTILKGSNIIQYTNIAKNFIALNQLDKAKVFLNKSLALIKNEKNKRSLGELYNNLGHYYYLIHDIPKANHYINLAEKEFQTIEDSFGLTDVYYYKGLIYVKEKNSAFAKVHFKKSLKIAKEIEVLDIQAKCLQALITINKNEKNWIENNNYYAELLVIKEKLNSTNNQKALAFVEMQNELELRQSAEILKINQQKQTNWMISFLLILAAIFMFFLYYSKKQKLINQNLALEKEKAELHHKALHLQMNPHFIFNCLGSISSFIIQNENDTAITYLNHFARLMRLTLENSKDKTITLEKEKETLLQYLELEQLRYENLFTYSIELKSIDENIKIPPMLLQPLIENAIIHGLVPRNENGKIEVLFQVSKNKTICIIKDNGVGYYSSKKLKSGSVLAHRSMAMEIIENRIKTLNGTITIKEGTAEKFPGTTITIILKN